MPIPAAGLIAFIRSPAAKWIGIALLVSGAAWYGYRAVFDRGVAHCEGVYAKAENARLKDDAKVLADRIKRAGEEARAIALQDFEVAAGTLQIQRQIEIKYRDREIEVIRHVKVDDAGCPGLTRFPANITGAKPSTRAYLKGQNERF